MTIYMIGLLSAVMLSPSLCAAVLWSEDFESIANNSGVDGTGNIGDYPGGITNWTLDVSGATLADDADFVKTDEDGGTQVLKFQDTDGPVIFETIAVNISGYSDVGFAIQVREEGDHESADYVKVEYSIDGGAFTLIGNWNSRGSSTTTLEGNLPNDDDWQVETVTASGLSGSSIKLRVTANNNAGSEEIMLDNLSITGTVAAPCPGTPVAASATGIGANDFTANWISTTNADGYVLDVATHDAFSAGGTSYGDGDGTESSPYSVTQAKALSEGSTEYWAWGYIVGGRYSDFATPWDDDYGVSVADSDSETTLGNCLQVKLESDGGRDDWGLNSNPGNYQKLIKFKGYRDSYGGYDSFEGVNNSDISEVTAGGGSSDFVSGYNGRIVGNVTSASVTGLTEGVDYYYRVRATNASCTGFLSNTQSVQTSTATPENPTAFSVVKDGINPSTKIDLSWIENANQDDVMVVYDLDGTFLVPSDGVAYSIGDTSLGGEVLHNGPMDSFSHSSLNPGETYFYKAWSVDESDRYSSGVTDTETTDCFGEPTAASATSVTNDAFQANWTQVPADGYLLTVALAPTFSNHILQAQSTLSSGGGRIGSASLESFSVIGRATIANRISTDPEPAELQAFNGFINFFDSSSGGGLIISEVMDGNRVGGTPKYIEITYAASGVTNLSGKKIKIGSNGGALSDAFTFGNVTLYSGDSYVIAADSNDMISAGFDPPDAEDGSINGNGNDVYALTESDNTVIDIFGSVGTSTGWYADSVAERLPSVTFPRSTYEASEWRIMAVSADSPASGTPGTPGSHLFSTGSVFVAGYEQRAVGDVSSFSVTGLTESATYYYRITATSELCDAVSGVVTVRTIAALAPEPSSQSTALSFDTVTTDSMTISWTPGDGDNRIVVVREGDPISGEPRDKTTYQADSAFGSGYGLGGGHVVYNGPGSSVSVSDLSADTVYHVRVFEYKGVAGEENYLTTTASGNPASRATLLSEPSQNPTALSFDSVGGHSMEISWANGDGSQTIVLIAEGTPVNSDPVDSHEYAAGGAFGTGDELGTGTFVAYIGSGSSFTVTGLSEGTTYYAAAYEFNGISGQNNYRTSDPATGSETTLVLSPPTLSSPTASFIGMTNATLGATIENNGNVSISEYGVVWNTVTGPTTNDSKWQTGSSISPPHTFTFMSNDLPEASHIFYRGYAVNTEGAGYSSEEDFYTEPAAQPTGISFSQIGSTSMRIVWSRGSGDGVIVLLRESGESSAQPQDGLEHAASTFFANCPEIGTANFPVYLGSGTQVDVIGLTPDTTYEVVLFEYAGSGTKINYRQSLPATASQSTTVLDPPTAFTAITNGTESSAVIDLSWTGNAVGDPVLLAWNNTGVFGTPVAFSEDYSPGDSIPGGGIVLQNSTMNNFSHTGLTPGNHYYYRIWSRNGTTYGAEYSTGVSADEATDCFEQPTANMATSIDRHTFQANWDELTNADGYVVEVALNKFFEDRIRQPFSTLSCAGRVGSLNGRRNVSVVGQGIHLGWLSSSTPPFYHTHPGLPPEASDVYEGGLILSEIMDGNRAGGAPKYVEVTYTGSGSTNLSGLKIRTGMNGAGLVDTYTFGDVTLSRGESFVLADSSADMIAAGYNAPDAEDGSINGNGNDVYALTQADNTVIDQFGPLGEINPWYADALATRNKYILLPSDEYDHTEWTMTSLAINSPDGGTPGTPGRHFFSAGSQVFVSGYEGRSVGGSSTTVTGLTALTTYYYRLYATNAYCMSAYSTTITVQTTADLPVVETLSADPSSPTAPGQAQAVGELLDDGGLRIPRMGICWNYGGSPTTNDHVALYAYDGTGTFSVILSGLTPGATVYYRAFAVNKLGVDYGDTLSFQADCIEYPSVLAAASITTNSFSANWSSLDGATGYLLDVATNNTFGAEQYVNGYHSRKVGDQTSVTVTGLLDATLYYYRIRATNLNCVSDYSGIITTRTVIAFAPEPSVQAHHISFDTMDATAMDISWTPGDGSRRIAVIRADDPVADSPTNSGVYSANSNFGTGDSLGGGSVIYNGSGNAVTVSNLLPATVYHVRIYDYNGDGIRITYNTNTAVENPSSQTTLSTEPTANPSLVTFDHVSAYGMDVSWDGGDGEQSIVLVSESSPVDADPADGTSYSANNTFGVGDEIGTGNYVAYIGSGSSCTLTGLTDSTTYHVAVYEWNGSGSTINYLTNTPAQGAQSTIVIGPPVLSSPTVASLADTSATLGATIVNNGNMSITDYGVVWATAPSPTISDNRLQEGTSATPPLAYTLNAEFLPQAAHIYFRGYASNVLGVGYSQEGQFVTEPSTQASSITFSDVATTRMTISWANGSGDGSILILKAESAVASTPTDSVAYSASATFGSGDEIGTDEFVVYVGTDGQVTVSNLQPGTVYHASVLEYAGSGSLINYKQAPSSTASQSTATLYPPTLFTAVKDAVNSMSEINVSWADNANGDPVLLAYNSVDSFGIPAGSYTQGASIAGGGIVLQTNTSDSFSHTNLSPGETVYYSAWSKDGNFYSVGVRTNESTDCFGAPYAYAATDITNFSFQANWSNVPPADGYVIEVSINSAFSNILYQSHCTMASGGGHLSSGSTNLYAVFGQLASVHQAASLPEPSDWVARNGFLYFPDEDAGGGLIISEVMDGNRGGGTPTYIEITYTGAGSTNLNGCKIRTGSDGGALSDAYTFGSVSLSAGDSFVLAASSADMTAAGYNAPDAEDGAINGNGNDVYALTMSDNTVIDLFGTVGETAPWYENSLATRDSSVLTPSDHYSTHEWTISPLMAGMPAFGIPGTPGTHEYSAGSQVFVDGYAGRSTGGTSISVTGLTAATTYYYRLYATNGYCASVYSSTIVVRTLGYRPTIATVSANPSMPANHTQAQAVGNLLDNGGYSIDEMGICWNLTGAPDTNDNKSMYAGGDTGLYTVVLNGLQPGYTIHYRAYAVNERGVSYGNTLTFQADCFLPPAALASSSVTTDTFIAHWESMPGATGYLLDVSSNATFTSTGGSAELFSESFESDGQGTRYFGVGMHTDNDEDYYGRHSNADCDRSYTGIDGTYWWGGQDEDDSGTVPKFLYISNINISGATSLRMIALFAEQRPEDGGNDDIDDDDYVHVTYQIDGGGWNNLIWFENDGSTHNTTFLEDTDFDGIGDGRQLETTFAAFTNTLSGTGSSLDIRFESSTQSGDEDWAVDHIRILGAGAASDDYLAGYEARKVGNVTSMSVTGLHDFVTYYYRIRATNIYCTSSYSGVITTKTLIAFSDLPDTQAHHISFEGFETNLLQISWTPGSGSRRIAVMREGAPVSSDPTNSRVYSANSQFGVGDTLGGGFVVYNGADSSVTVSNLSADTMYHVRVYEYNGTSFRITYLTNAAVHNPSARTTLAPEPQENPLPVTLDNIGGYNMDVTWTGGNGAQSIVLVSESSPVDADPADGTAYSANNTFGVGDEIGSGNYVAYTGSESSCTLTGLTDGTTYYVAVYEWNGSGDAINYLTVSPGTASATTVELSVPLLSSPTMTNITDTTAILGATLNNDGNAPITDYGIVWAQAPNPTIGDNKVQEGTSSIPPETYDLNAGSLPPASHIYFRGYAINHIGEAYSPQGEFHTEPSSQASAISFSEIEATSMTISWTPGSGHGSMLVLHENTPVTATPSDRSEYTASTTFGTGDDIGSGDHAVYIGGGSQVTVTCLKPDTTYHAAVFEFAGSGSLINYIQTSPGTGSQATPSLPPPSSFTAEKDPVNNTREINLEWENNPNGDLVLLAWNLSDTFGVPSGSYSPGDSIPGGGTVLFFGSATNYAHTECIPGDRHYYSLWSKSCDYYSSNIITDETTDCFGPPLAYEATPTTNNSFMASWSNVYAQGYVIDVSLTPTFTSTLAQSHSVISAAGRTQRIGEQNGMFCMGLGIHSGTIQPQSRPPDLNDTTGLIAPCHERANGGLILSEVMDGNRPGGAPKYIEITYTGSGSVQLNGMKIRRGSNGGALVDAFTFGDRVLFSGDSFVIAESAADMIAAGFPSPDAEDGSINGNGDDVYALTESDNTIIDLFGTIGETNDWYMDSRAVRKSFVLLPSQNWNVSEWTISTLSGGAPESGVPGSPGSHNYSAGTQVFVPGYEGLEVGTITNISVTGLTESVYYYYRIKATSDLCEAYSGIITVETTFLPPRILSTHVGNPVYSGTASNQLYFENFNAPYLNNKGAQGDSSSGTTTNMAGVTNFVIDTSNAALDGDSSLNWFRVENGRFEAQDVDGYATWRSQNIDISNISSVDVSLVFHVLNAGKNSSSDFGFEWGIELDGAYIPLFDIGRTADGDTLDQNTLNGMTVATNGIDVRGSTGVVIRVEMGANGGGDGFQFDDVRLIGHQRIQSDGGWITDEMLVQSGYSITSLIQDIGSGLMVSNAYAPYYALYNLQNEMVASNRFHTPFRFGSTELEEVYSNVPPANGGASIQIGTYTALVYAADIKTHAATRRTPFDVIDDDSAPPAHSRLSSAFGQTNLHAGDIAIVNYQLDPADGKPEYFAFVALADIVSNTVIHFTDRGWDNGDWNSSENTLPWTAPCHIAAGTVISNQASPMTLNNAGDQLFAYQLYNGSTTFLFGVNMNHTSWQANPADTSESELAPGLNPGLSALSLPHENATYAGPITGSKADLLRAIANPAMWIGNDLELEEPVPAGPFMLSHPATSTNLLPGDIAVVGYTLENNQDSFAFMALCDLPVGTAISFTDNGWNDDDTFRSDENTLTYTITTAMPAGAVEVLSDQTTDGRFGSYDGDALAWDTDGDQLFAYQGDNSKPVFLFGVNLAVHEWQADATDAETSAKPNGLVPGYTALAIDYDNATNNFALSEGTRLDYLAIACNVNEWTGDDGPANYTMPSLNVDVYDAVLTDGAMLQGYTFHSIAHDAYSGLPATSGKRPHYVIYETAGGSAVYSNAFDISYSDGSTATQILSHTLTSALSFGTYTAILYVADADNDRTGDSMSVTGMPLRILVRDDDTAPPVLSGIRLAGNSTEFNVCLTDSTAITSILTEASGLLEGIGGSYMLIRNDSDEIVQSNRFYASTAPSSATGTVFSTGLQFGNTYTVRIVALDNDNDRVGDIMGSTNSTFTFTVTGSAIEGAGVDLIAQNLQLDDLSPDTAVITDAQLTNGGWKLELEIDSSDVIFTSGSTPSYEILNAADSVVLGDIKWPSIITNGSVLALTDPSVGTVEAGQINLGTYEVLWSASNSSPCRIYADSATNITGGHSFTVIDDDWQGPELKDFRVCGVQTVEQSVIESGIIITGLVRDAQSGIRVSGFPQPYYEVYSHVGYVAGGFFTNKPSVDGMGTDWSPIGATAPGYSWPCGVAFTVLVMVADNDHDRLMQQDRTITTQRFRFVISGDTGDIQAEDALVTNTPLANASITDAQFVMGGWQLGMKLIGSDIVTNGLNQPVFNLVSPSGFPAYPSPQTWDHIAFDSNGYNVDKIMPSINPAAVSEVGPYEIRFSARTHGLCYAEAYESTNILGGHRFTVIDDDPDGPTIVDNFSVAGGTGDGGSSGCNPDSTNLVAGDIAIIGMNTWTKTTPTDINLDSFAFVATVDIADGTEIQFTDNGWNCGELYQEEGYMTWRADTCITAGTVVIFQKRSDPTNAVSSPWVNIGTVVQIDANDFLINRQREQILAFQGPVDNPRFLYALHTAAAEPGTWDECPITDFNSHNSALPPGLENGKTAVSVNNHDDVVLSTNEANLIIEGDRDAVLAYIGNYANWIGHDEIVYPLDTWTFQFPSLGSAGGTITDHDVLIGGWDITGQVYDAVSGIDASTVRYEGINTNGEIFVNNLFSGVTDGSVAIQNLTIQVPGGDYNYITIGSNNLVRIHAADKDSDRVNDQAASILEVPFTVVDDDTDPPHFSAVTWNGKSELYVSELDSVAITARVVDVTSGIAFNSKPPYFMIVNAASEVIFSNVFQYPVGLSDGDAGSNNYTDVWTDSMNLSSVLDCGAYTCHVVLVDNDNDRPGDSRTTTNMTVINLANGSVQPPALLDDNSLMAEGTPVKELSNQVTDQKINEGGWQLSIALSHVDGIMTNSPVYPRYTLYTPHTNEIISLGWTNYTRTAVSFYGTNIMPELDMDSFSFIDTGKYVLAWAARSFSACDAGTQVFTNLLVVDDDPDSPNWSTESVTLMHDGYPVTDWTNVSTFNLSWAPGSDYSEFHYRHCMNVFPSGLYDGVFAADGMATQITGLIFPEGVTTNWLFAVDEDNDRPNDRMRTLSAQTVARVDITKPEPVSLHHAAEGADPTSEILLQWDPCTPGDKSDGTPLSPWDTYIVYTKDTEDGITQIFTSVENPSLSYTGTIKATVSNLLFGRTYDVWMQGRDKAGNMGLESDIKSVTLGRFSLTQGVAYVTCDQDIQLAWTATNSEGTLIRDYDVLFVDAPNYNDSLAYDWKLAARVRSRSFTDRGGPTALLDEHFKFFSASRLPPGWGIEGNPIPETNPAHFQSAPQCVRMNPNDALITYPVRAPGTIEFFSKGLSGGLDLYYRTGISNDWMYFQTHYPPYEGTHFSYSVDLYEFDFVQFKIRCTTGTVFIDDMRILSSFDLATTRVPPADLGNNLRFYRAAHLNSWVTNRSRRIASEEVYALRAIELFPGQNWVSIPCIPDTNTVDFILGHNLPSSSLYGDGTIVSWYARTNSEAVKKEIWLSSYSGWQYNIGGQGYAGDLALPLFEGFMVEIPTNTPEQQFIMAIGRVPSEPTFEQTIKRGAYNFVGYNMPRFNHPADMNLRESGFEGSVWGPPFPGFIGGDIMWTWDAQNQQVKNYPVYFDNMSQKWRYMNGNPGTEVTEDVFNPEDGIIIYRNPSDFFGNSFGDFVWTNKLLFAPPTPIIGNGSEP